MGFAAWPMHQHISMLVFSPLLRPALTSLPILKVFVIVTFGIGAFFQSSNARPRGDDCGSISLLISKNSCSVSLFGVAKILLFYEMTKKGEKGFHTKKKKRCPSRRVMLNNVPKQQNIRAMMLVRLYVGTAFAVMLGIIKKK